MVRKRVAVVQPVLIPGGGTEAVTAWTIEALKTGYDVSLVSFSDVNPDVLNQYYGTELKAGEFSTIRPGLPPLLQRTKRFLLLKDHLMMRYCKSVGSRFDLFIGVGGGMDFGSHGVQYMALAPGSTLVKVLGHGAEVPTWYRLAKLAFMRLSQLISAYSQQRVKQNITLVTSQWAGNLVERVFGIPHWKVVYPPVDVFPEKAPWAPRENGFLCIARISPEKNLGQVIQILQLVREKGFDISLRIFGRQDDPHYFQEIKRVCEESGSWAVLEGPMARQELRSLMTQVKYGINAATDEPFGIALAEMVNAGCIVFVPDSGGQTEVVDDPQLTYSGVDDAVEKITKVLESKSLQQSLLGRLENQEEVFSTQAFCGAMRMVAGEFFVAR